MSNMEKPGGSGEGKTTEAMNVVRDEALELASYRLVVIEGQNTGAEITLDIASPSRVLIGQSQACQIVLSDRQVSRRHAAVDLHGRHGVKVVDLGSTNGTRVNGVRVMEAMLEPGDRIVVGGSTLRLDLTTTPKNEAPSFTPSVSFGRVLGASIAMRRLYPLCERLAQSDLPATIEGETGVGKELLAEAIHETGPRKAKPFVVFDCAGVRGEAVLRVLFGDGAPDGTSAFEQAAGGTLLLDEVAELGDDAQARLLRFIDRREVRRDPNGTKGVEVDVRLLATSRRDLDQAVQAGRFRDELFFRIAVSRVELPPLREREGDVEILARAFWKTMSGKERTAFPAAMLERYESYKWPGNVRELKNVVARRIALGAFAEAGGTDAAHPHQAGGGTGGGASSASGGGGGGGGDVIESVLGMDLPLVEARAKVVSEFEARYLAKVLDEHGGNVSRAAAASGIARRYFQLLRARIGRSA
jgi:two-component system, NtrC family, response regulator HydG